MTKREKQITKIMLKNSLKNGSVDNSKVRNVLKRITAQKPLHLTSILKTYKRLIMQALAKEEVVVESAGKISVVPSLEKSLKEKAGAKRIVYKTNTAMVLGARITHGDWIYDASLDSKLEQLTKFEI